uniref:RNA-directed RNA polymerase n=1 Tax=Shenzhen reo-like virus 2 TaxID=2789380 RepID=A0A7T1GW13_9REOV|nr:hypothetical protein [Shenzhen reo-like virus 2]
MTISGKEANVAFVWNNLFKDVPIDTELNEMVLNKELIFWYDIPDKDNIYLRSEIPQFKLTDKIEKRFVFDRSKDQIIRVRNDHSDRGYNEVSFWDYLTSRAKKELNPKFVAGMKPSHILLMLRKVIELSYEKSDPIYIAAFRIISLVKSWMDKFGKMGSKYQNPVRVSEGEISSWSTDSHFLKRLAVAMNGILLLIMYEKFIRRYPPYCDVVVELCSNMFINYIEFIRDYKKVHGKMIAAPYLIPWHDTATLRKLPVKVPFHELKGQPDEGAFDAHLHCAYKERFEWRIYKLQRDKKLPPHAVCQSCMLKFSQDKFFIGARLPQIKDCLKELNSKLNLKHTAKLAALCSVRLPNITSPMAIAALNSTMVMSGFTETGPIADVEKTLTEAREFTDSEDNNFDGARATIKVEFHKRLVYAYKNLMKVCMDKGLFIKPHEFKNMGLSLVTGKSSGLGTYTLNLDDTFDLHGEKVKSIKFTDKRMTYLTMSDKLMNFNSQEQITRSYKSWREKIEMDKTIEFDEKIDPMKYPDGKALKQNPIGIRNVPGGKPTRAVYINSIFIHILQHVAYPYIEYYRRKYIPEYAKDIFPNEEDGGLTNAKVLIDNTEGFMDMLVYASTQEDALLYWIDFSGYDTSETYDATGKFKFNGIREFIRDYKSAYVTSDMFKEPYLVIDGQPAAYPEIIAFLERAETQNYYFIKDRAAIKEFQVRHLPSGSLGTYDENTINNSMQTSIANDMLVENIENCEGMTYVVISGDDNGGVILDDHTVHYNEEQMQKMLSIVMETGVNCGFRVNEQKSGMGQGQIEMAKIIAVQGTVLRAGATQLFEAEKHSKALTITEDLRGLANKLQMFMTRYPMRSDVWYLVQHLTLLLAYKLDITGKRKDVNSGSTIDRRSFFPNPIVHITNPNLEGGLGATISGCGLAEFAVLMRLMKNGDTKNLFLMMCDLASRIKFKTVNELVDKLKNYIKKTKFTVTAPNGSVYSNAFTNLARSLNLDQLSLDASKKSNQRLKNLNVKIDDRALYKNSRLTSVEESLKSALSSQKSKTLRLFELTEAIKSKLDPSRAKGMLDKSFPLLMRHHVQFGNPTLPIFKVTKYDVCADSLQLVYRQVGPRYGLGSITNFNSLKPYTDVIASARRTTHMNPSVTEESLRDIVISALNHAKGNTSAQSVVEDVIIAIFGQLDDLVKLVSGIVRDQTAFRAAELGYTASGSIMTNVDVNMDNMQRLVTSVELQYKRNFHLQMGFYMFMFNASVTGIARSITLTSGLDYQEVRYDLLPLAAYFSPQIAIDRIDDRR